MKISENAVNPLERALLRGFRIHAFRSGGGLRVVRLSEGGTLRGYGEHPSLDTALEHCAEDYLAGGRPYRNVYGKVHDRYLTGSSQSSSELDRWVLSGSTFDMFASGATFTVELHGLGETRTPDDVQERVWAGETMFWTCPRGNRFKSSPVTFADGHAGCQTQLVEKVTGLQGDTWHFRIVKTGSAATLLDAIDEALAAPERERTKKMIAPQRCF